MNRYVFQPLKRLFRQPRFLVCAIVLGICAAGLHVSARALKLHLRKEPVMLRNPLQELDISRLGDYHLESRRMIEEEIAEELGTKDYIQYLLSDMSVEKNDPRRLVSLFVTYYTGDPDKVPHVPDWCYTGGGGEIVRRENTTITVPGNGSDSDELPVRILDVKVQRGYMERQSLTVLYFFSVNGDYRCTRDQVRVRQNRLRDKYAYFCKVELNLADARDLGREEIIAALEKFAQRLVPVLVEEHWPDWEALNNPKVTN